MNKLHLIPQAIIDCGENLKTAPQHLKDMHLSRLEATKEYVDGIIQSYHAKLFTGKPIKNK